jgi:hypothetical protein
MPHPAPAHVALIGCGFTGTSTLLQLIDRSAVRQITVFEGGGSFGPGYAWQPDECPDYLVNNTTDTMCLLPGNRQAFLQWLQGRGDAPDPRGHLPRRDYGAFLAEAVRAAQVLAAAKGIVLRCIPAVVDDLTEPAEGGVQLRWPGGETRADVAILTTGRCPDRPLVAPPPAGSAARYVPSHIGDRSLDALPLDATCHVLGASLSAYDVVNRLFGPGTGCRFTRDADGSLRFEPGPNRRRVVLCSRSGRLKKIESRRRMAIQRTVLTDAALAARAVADGGLTLASLVEAIDAEAHQHGVALDWPALRDPYAGCASAEAVNQRAATLLAADIAAASEGRNFLVDLAGNAQLLLWDAFAARLLRPSEEQRYRSEAETAVRCWTAPCPIPTAERLLALQRAGQLVVRHGARTPRWSAAEDGWQIDCAFGTEHARVLVNATGTVDRQVDSPAQSLLLQSLVAQGLLRPYRLAGASRDGAAVDMRSFRAEGSHHVHVLNMLLWGPGFFTSSAFVMAQLASRLLDGLYGPERAARPA